MKLSSAFLALMYLLAASPVLGKNHYYGKVKTPKTPKAYYPGGKGYYPGGPKHHHPKGPKGGYY